jgi:hypothetical protein
MSYKKESLLAIAEKRWLMPKYDQHVMIASRHKKHIARHLVLRRDAGGLYIRMRKHGAIKRYLSRMDGYAVAPMFVVFFDD